MEKWVASGSCDQAKVFERFEDRFAFRATSSEGIVAARRGLRHGSTGAIVEASTTHQIVPPMQRGVKLRRRPAPAAVTRREAIVWLAGGASLALPALHCVRRIGDLGAPGSICGIPGESHARHAEERKNIVTENGVPCWR
jgi:hypothetical protein